MRAVLLAALLTSACTTASLPDEQPAVLVAPTASARAELQEIIGAALSHPQLLLADDALTRQPTLILERIPRKDTSGALLNGRELGTPERFALFVQAARCLLVHERTGQRWQLRHAQCRTVAPAAP